MSPDISIISTDNALRAFCERIKNHSFLAVDTEFMRVSTYWPRLCLIQVGTPNETVIIDPLKGEFDLSPFFDTMMDPTIVKVFHSARQDLEIFWRLTGRVPAPIFDTQVAAMALTTNPSISFDKLIEQFLGKTIDKSAQRSPWDVRPLTDDQIAYAAEDARALAEVYQVIMEQLSNRHRLSWILNENRFLERESLYKPDPQGVFRRIRLSDGNPVVLARLQSLAAIREEEAMGRDLPRGHLLKDDFLIDLAKTNPASISDMKKLTSYPKIEDGVLMDRLLSSLISVSDLDPSCYPKPVYSAHRPDEKRARQKIQDFFIKLSDIHQVCPRLWGTSDECMAWIRAFKGGDFTLDCLNDWRQDYIKDPVLGILQTLFPKV